MIARTNYQEYQDKRRRQIVNKTEEAKENAVYIFMVSTLNITRDLVKVQELIEATDSKTGKEYKTFLTKHIRKQFRNVFGHEMIKEDNGGDRS